MRRRLSASKRKQARAIGSSDPRDNWSNEEDLDAKVVEAREMMSAAAKDLSDYLNEQTVWGEIADDIGFVIAQLPRRLTGIKDGTRTKRGEKIDTLQAAQSAHDEAVRKARSAKGDVENATSDYSPELTQLYDSVGKENFDALTERERLLIAYSVADTSGAGSISSAEIPEIIGRGGYSPDPSFQTYDISRLASIERPRSLYSESRDAEPPQPLNMSIEVDNLALQKVIKVIVDKQIIEHGKTIMRTPWKIQP
jgi:hypothetical protein